MLEVPPLTPRLIQRVLYSPILYLHPQVFSGGDMGWGQSGHSTWASAPEAPLILQSPWRL